MGFAISAALLDFCVLAIVAQEDVYGYALTHRLMESADLSESTLYPVLRRLKNKLLDTYDKQYEGRNRRYYTITEKGGSSKAI